MNNELKSFISGAIGGVLVTLLLDLNRKNDVEKYINENLVFRLSSSGSSSNSVGTGFVGTGSGPSVFLTQNFNTLSESLSNTPGTTGPLRQSSTHYEFDATYLGPDYGTNGDDKGNINMGYRSHETSILGESRISIGNFAGDTGQGDSSVAIGVSAGEENQGVASVSVGPFAGEINQGERAVAIGNGAGEFNQSTRSVAIGNFAGNTAQGEYGIAIGHLSGQTNQGINCIAMGFQAGQTNQKDNTIAIGGGAGNTNQKDFSIAIGNVAGQISQGIKCIAIGLSTGRINQGESSIAIGNATGQSNQGANCVAIGNQAGQTDQVSNSICIGAGSSIQSSDETTSYNKIALCVTARDSSTTDGGATAQESFVCTPSTSRPFTLGPIRDGITNPSTAGFLATHYGLNAQNIGFLNIKINRGAKKFVGFLPVLNLYEYS